MNGTAWGHRTMGNTNLARSRSCNFSLQKHATRATFITCSNVLLDLLVPGKIYCRNVKLGSSKTGIGPHVPPHRSPYGAAAGRRPFPAEGGTGGPSWLPPASRRPAATCPSWFTTAAARPMAGFGAWRGLASVRWQA